MAFSTSRFRGGADGIGAGTVWFHDCPLNGPTDTLKDEICDCGAVERRSRTQLRAVLQCIEGGRPAD